MGGRGRGIGRVLPAWMTKEEEERGDDEEYRHRHHQRRRSRSPPPKHHEDDSTAAAAARSNLLGEIVGDLDAIRDERSQTTRNERFAKFVRKAIDQEEFVYEDDAERGGVDAMRRYFVNVLYHPPLHTAFIQKDSHVAYLVQFLRTSKISAWILYEGTDGLLTRCYVFQDSRDVEIKNYASFRNARKWPIILRYLKKKGLSQASGVNYTNVETRKTEQMPLVIEE